MDTPEAIFTLNEFAGVHMPGDKLPSEQLAEYKPYDLVTFVNLVYRGSRFDPDKMIVLLNEPEVKWNIHQIQCLPEIRVVLGPTGNCRYRTLQELCDGAVWADTNERIGWKMPIPGDCHLCHHPKSDHREANDALHGPYLMCPNIDRNGKIIGWDWSKIYAATIDDIDVGYG